MLFKKPGRYSKPFRKRKAKKKTTFRKKDASKKFSAKVLQHNNLGAVVVDTGKRGSRRFWIRIGRIRPSFASVEVEVTKGFYIDEVLSLPGLALQIARYISRQAIVRAIEPDDVHFRKELREDLMLFIRSFQKAKWDGTFPKHLTFLTRRHCRCFFDAQEKGFTVVVPQLVEVEQGPVVHRKQSKFARIDKALGFRTGE